MTFGLTANIFRVLGQTVSFGVSKLHFMFPKKRYIEEEKFLEKPIAFLFIFGPWTKRFFDFCWTNCGIVAKFAFELRKRIFWQKQRFRKKNFLSYFSDFKRKTFGTLAKSSWLRSLNCILQIQRKFFGICLEYGWPILSLWDFLKRNIGCIFKTAFYRAKTIVKRNIPFFSIKTVFFTTFQEMELIFFRIWAEKSYRCDQISVRCAPWNILSRTMSLKKLFFVFQTSSEKLSDKGKNIWLRSFKGILGVQRNFSGRFCFWILLVFWSKIFWGGCQNCFPSVHRIVFWRKTLFGLFVKFFVQFRTLK